MPSALSYPPVDLGSLQEINSVINGSFLFAQRQTTNTLTTYSNTTGRSFAADRWGITNENASVQYARGDGTTPITGLLERFYGRYVKITNTGKLVLSQAVETNTSVPMRGKVVTLSAKLRRAVAGSMTVILGLAELQAAASADTIPATFISAFGAASTDPTLGTNLAYIAPIAGSGENGTIVTNGLSCALTADFVRYSVSFVLPSNSKNFIPMVWTDSGMAAADELHIAEVGLYASTVPITWNPIGVELEQQRVLRYYAKSFNVGTGPAQNVGATTGPASIASPVGATTALTGWEFRYPVPLRNPGTLTLYNPSAGNAEARDVTAAADCTGTTAATNGTGGCIISTTTPGGTVAGNRLAIHITVDAEF